MSDGGSGPASTTFAALGGHDDRLDVHGLDLDHARRGHLRLEHLQLGERDDELPDRGRHTGGRRRQHRCRGDPDVHDDSTAPPRRLHLSGCAGNYNAAGWSGSITGSASDGGADLLRVDVAIQQGSGNYYDGNSFANGSLTWLTATGTTSWSYAIAAAKLTSGNVYTISLRAIDNVGNTAATITRTFTYDTAAPSFGTLALGAPTNASVTGATVYYRSGAAGSFILSQPLSDTGGSGSASVQFPAIATSGWTHGNETVNGASPYVSSTFSWSASPSTPAGFTLTGADAAGNTAMQGVSFVADSAAPTGGALTVNGIAATGGGSSSTSNGNFTISRTDYIDAGSGIATSMLTRDVAPFANDTCGAYSGSPTTIGGAPAETLATGCYEYVLTGTDAVGNTTSIRTAVQVHGPATQIAAERLDDEPHLGRDARADCDAPRRRRQHRHLRQLDRDCVREAVGRRAPSAGTGNATASGGVATKTVTGALAGSVTMEATSAGLTTGTLGAFTVVHGAATAHRADGLDRRPRLRRDAPADSDDRRRRRQHRHLRQLHRRRVRQQPPAPAPSAARGTRPPRAASPPRRSPAPSPAPSRWRRPPPDSRPARSAPSTSSTAPPRRSLLTVARPPT